MEYLNHLEQKLAPHGRMLFKEIAKFVQQAASGRKRLKGLYEIVNEILDNESRSQRLDEGSKNLEIF